MNGFRSVFSMLLASVCLMGNPTTEAQAQPAPKPGPLSAEILWSLKRLASPSISPDGRWCAVAVTRYNVEEDKSFSDIWLVSTTPGEPARIMTTHAASDSNPAWSPDGKWIAFIAKRDEDTANQVYVIPTDGGEARRVTNVPTGASAPKWFPDSSRIAFITRVWPDLTTWEEMKTRLEEREKSKMTAKVWDSAHVRWWDSWLDDREVHVYSIARDGGEPTAITLPTGQQLSRAEPGPDSYDISHDGREIAFASDVDTTSVNPNFDIFLVSVDGGEALNITRDNSGQDTSPLYSPDGRRLAFLRQTINGFYADRQRMMMYDRTTKKLTNCTEAWDRSAGGLVWAPDGQTLYGAIDDAGHDRVYRFKPEPGVPQAVTRGMSFSSLGLSRNGSTLVGLRQGFSEPPTLVRINLQSGEATKLSTFNDEVLANVQFGNHESVTYTGSGGAEIQMWIVYPPGFDPNKKWPVYLLIHGGPHNGITDSFHYRWNAQVFSGWGYVTGWHNFHGSSGFGQDFTDSINPNRADKPYEDTIAAAKYLASQPWVDPDRMAAGGGSYGGYLSTVILGREHPFKTLIVHAGVYNLYTQYAADYGAQRRRHGEFWVDPDMMKITSPHYGAANFNTPTLVIHGQSDYRVPVNHGIELFNTLQNRGVRSRLIYYPNENHWVLKPQNSLFWYQQKKEWLKEFIGTGFEGF
jgi:dipeptidyl aminopeptidase/acylaminoacyl peptidase